ncbi:MAG TPA: tetratricopeptide repeat protein [Pirellulales bacterium]|nr:tetratricopeptide repeat protein [Pirellulales bacterium]
MGLREFARAKVDLDDAIRLNPRDAAAYRGRAATWFASGDHDRAIADYTEAIRLYLDTLAAACAESDDFGAAVRWQTKALALIADTNPAERTLMESRLDLYRAGRSYQEDTLAE